MRVVVKIPSHAYAELQAELERIPPRERAERLRLLAAVGLILAQSGWPSTAVSEDTQQSMRSEFRRIRRRLMATLD